MRMSWTGQASSAVAGWVGKGRTDGRVVGSLVHAVGVRVGVRHLMRVKH